MNRVETEIALINNQYGSYLVSEDHSYVLFQDFPLPKGWNFESTRLLILIPAAYPQMPPDNFYVKPGLRLESGAMPASYTEGSRHLEEPWGQFSMHLDGPWRPAADITSGDNLLTFLIIVNGRLSESN